MTATATKTVVAQLADNKIGGAERVRLVALANASPDLLAALEEARQQLDDFRAAIVSMNLSGRFIDDGVDMMGDNQTAILAADAALAKAKGETCPA